MTPIIIFYGAIGARTRAARSGCCAGCTCRIATSTSTTISRPRAREGAQPRPAPHADPVWSRRRGAGRAGQRHARGACRARDADARGGARTHRHPERRRHRAVARTTLGRAGRQRRRCAAAAPLAAALWPASSRPRLHCRLVSGVLGRGVTSLGGPGDGPQTKRNGPARLASRRAAVSDERGPGHEGGPLATQTQRIRRSR